MVWTHWTGDERGGGEEQEYCRREILPTPRVINLDSISRQPYSAGSLPVGSIKLERVSTSLTADNLQGLSIFEPEDDTVPERYSFYYEVVEDGRGDDPPARMKFRLFGLPAREAGKVQWVVMLERISEDNARDGSSKYGEDP
jgi:hypothetical protein